MPWMGCHGTGPAASSFSAGPEGGSARGSTSAGTARHRGSSGTGGSRRGSQSRDTSHRSSRGCGLFPSRSSRQSTGPAAGGGFALVLGSDIRIAAASARFNAAFIRIGLSACDIGTSWLLPRIVGAARAQELMLTGRLFGADEALRIGLVTDVVPDDALDDAVLSKATEIMLNSPIGVALTKEGMWSALEIPGLQAAIDLENRQQIMASFSQDAAETRLARSEKRAPRYES